MCSTMVAKILGSNCRLRLFGGCDFISRCFSLFCVSDPPPSARIDELTVHSNVSGAKTLSALSIYGSRTLLACCRPALCPPSAPARSALSDLRLATAGELPLAIG